MNNIESEYICKYQLDSDRPTSENNFDYRQGIKATSQLYSDLTMVWQNISSTKPLVHCLTNYVTAGDCANTLLAVNAQPVMAEAVAEVSEITAVSNALYLNLGTLNPQKLEAMILAGKTANKLGIPIILDPVGAGASHFRRQSCRDLLNMLDIAAIKGNFNEIQAILDDQSNQRGVDADFDNQITSNLSIKIQVAESLAKRSHSTVVVTGPIDILTNGWETYTIGNGHPLLTRITGAGCRLGALIAAAIGANPNSNSMNSNCNVNSNILACLAGILVFNIASERAGTALANQDGYQQPTGPGTFAVKLIDNLYSFTPELFATEAQIKNH